MGAGIEPPTRGLHARHRDAGVTELDSRIQGLVSAIPDSGPIKAVATAVAGKAAEVKGKLDALTALVNEAKAKLAELNAKVAALNRDLQSGHSEISTLRQELRNQTNKAATDAVPNSRLPTPEACAASSARSR